VLTATFPPALVDRVVAETGRTQQRHRLLPARVDWVTGVTWVGVEPDQVDQQLLRRNAALGGPVGRIAQTVDMTTEHHRLYAEISGITAPDQRERKRPLRTAHQGVLAPDQLRQLYERRRLSIVHVAKLAGCGREVVRDALRMAGIETREAHRQRSLPITREWLEEEYITKERTLVDIAHELGTSRPRVTSYAKEWNLPLRPRGHVPDPLAPVRHQVHPSAEIEAAFAGHDALQRIRRIVHLPGHRSLRAAATAMGLYQGTLHKQLHRVEQALGFEIIERSLPLRLTPRARCSSQTPEPSCGCSATQPQRPVTSGLFKSEPPSACSTSRIGRIPRPWLFIFGWTLQLCRVHGYLGH
jgi:Bacterial regulatory helix-turn-helix protein, lysR family/Insertion element 4 transposase N-terminal